MTQMQYKYGCAVLDQVKEAHRRNQLTRHQYRTLRGQIMSGNAAGALKGLRKLLLLQGSNAVKKM